MREIIKEKLKWFIGGSFVGGYAGFTFLFNGNTHGIDLALGYTFKFFGTIILAFVSGVATVAAHDFYKIKMKNFLYKKKRKKK